MHIHRRQLLAAAGLLTLAGCGSESSSVNPASAQVPSGTQGQSLLFVLDADGGTLSGDELTLRPVSPSILFFADRPGRLAGQQSTSQFVSDWPRYGFAQDAPNAVVKVGAGLASLNRAVILRDPVYRPEQSALSFKVQPDPGNPGNPLPGTFGPCSLFIDGTSPGSPPSAGPTITSTNPSSISVSAPFTNMMVTGTNLGGTTTLTLLLLNQGAELDNGNFLNAPVSLTFQVVSAEQVGLFIPELDELGLYPGPATLVLTTPAGTATLPITVGP